MFGKIPGAFFFFFNEFQFDAVSREKIHVIHEFLAEKYHVDLRERHRYIFRRVRL